MGVSTALMPSHATAEDGAEARAIGLWLPLVEKGATWELSGGIDSEEYPLVRVSTYDVREVAGATVARLRWTYEGPGGVPTQVAVTSKGVYFFDASKKDEAITKILRGAPHYADPPDIVPIMTSPSGEYVEERDGEIFCIGEGPAPGDGECGDVCYSEVCFSAEDGIVGLGGWTAPGEIGYQLVRGKAKPVAKKNVAKKAASKKKAVAKKAAPKAALAKPEVRLYVERGFSDNTQMSADLVVRATNDGVNIRATTTYTMESWDDPEGGSHTESEVTETACVSRARLDFHPNTGDEELLECSNGVIALRSADGGLLWAAHEPGPGLEWGADRWDERTYVDLTADGHPEVVFTGNPEISGTMGSAWAILVVTFDGKGGHTLYGADASEEMVERYIVEEDERVWWAHDVNVRKATATSPAALIHTRVDDNGVTVEEVLVFTPVDKAAKK